MPCEDQEEKAPQGSSRAGTLISDFQPPELWEVNVCCLSQPLFGICYSSLSSPRHFLHFRLHNLNSPVFRSAHEPYPAIFLCSYHTSSLQNLYIFFVKIFFFDVDHFKVFIELVMSTKKKDVQLVTCELSFIWGKRRSAAREAASQIALRDCSKAAVGESQCMRFWWKGSSIPWTTQFTKGFFVSHEGLMSPWRDLVLL